MEAGRVSTFFLSFIPSVRVFNILLHDFSVLPRRHCNQQQVETVVNFVVRVALFAMANLKDTNISHLSKQCLRLLESALTLWPDTPMKYT